MADSWGVKEIDDGGVWVEGFIFAPHWLGLTSPPVAGQWMSGVGSSPTLKRR